MSTNFCQLDLKASWRVLLSRVSFSLQLLRRYFYYQRREMVLQNSFSIFFWVTEMLLSLWSFSDICLLSSLMVQLSSSFFDFNSVYSQLIDSNFLIMEDSSFYFFFLFYLNSSSLQLNLFQSYFIDSFLFFISLVRTVISASLAYKVYYTLSTSFNVFFKESLSSLISLAKRIF